MGKGYRIASGLFVIMFTSALSCAGTQNETILPMNAVSCLISQLPQAEQSIKTAQQALVAIQLNLADGRPIDRKQIDNLGSSIATLSQFLACLYVDRSNGSGDQ